MSHDNTGPGRRTTGALKYSGRHLYHAEGGESEIVVRDGGRIVSVSGFFDFYACVDCGTSYICINGNTRCNGVAISLCPWCRPDYAPLLGGA